MRIHFIGVGGSGMSGLAQLYAWEGNQVSGSDRAWDRGEAPDRFQCLAQQGIRLLPEDGSGVDGACDLVVASAAIESDHPDLLKAQQWSVPVQQRSQAWAARLNRTRSMAIVGTSGKSTTASMLSFILAKAGLDPEVLIGAEVPSLPGARGLCNARPGASGWSVAEVDESDGTVDRVNPHFAVFTSVSKDHKPVDVVEASFKALAERTQERILYNADDAHLQGLLKGREKSATFGLSPEADYAGEVLSQEGWHVELALRGHRALLQTPGRFNALNAVAAMAAASEAGVSVKDALAILSEFPGLKRRMERMGQARGVTVVDDFAHNPEKVAASLSFLTSSSKRLFIYYQPHGFGPTAFFKHELIQAFSAGLRPTDRLFFAPIYYVGGTANKAITSQAIVEALKAQGVDATVAQSRSDFLAAACDNATPGDAIVVMGARDPTLPELAQASLGRLKA